MIENSTIDVTMTGVADLPSLPDFQASTLRNPREWLWESLSGARSDSGLFVNPVSALKHPSVWQAVNVLCGDIGQIPFELQTRRGPEGEETIKRDRRHRVDRLFNQNPTPLHTPSVFLELVMFDALLYGNHVSAIVDEPDGSLTLLPLDPRETSPEKADDYTYFIKTRMDDRQLQIPYERVFHIQGLSENGFWGIPVIQKLKDAIGNAQALQQHQGRFWRNGARPSGVVKSDKKWNMEAAKNLRAEWEQAYAGTQNAGRVVVLWDGMDYQTTSMSNHDAETVELRKLDNKTIAQIFNLPLFKLNSLEDSSVRANVEEQNRDYAKSSLSRWANRICQEAWEKLFNAREKRLGRIYLKPNFEHLLQADMESRYNAYSVGITSQFLSPNEVRRKENLNPYDGGDEFKNPAINPASEQTDTPPADDDQDSRDEDAQALLQERINAMLDVEGNRVRMAAKNGNFVAWANEFYCGYEEFAAQFVNLASRVAGIGEKWRPVVRAHAAMRCRELIQTADAATGNLNDHLGARGGIDELTATTLYTGMNHA